MVPLRSCLIYGEVGHVDRLRAHLEEHRAEAVIIGLIYCRSLRLCLFQCPNVFWPFCSFFFPYPILLWTKTQHEESLIE